MSNERYKSVRRFACTQCGACCNRSPEVELSEAAALADVFVFRLMFRLYTLPRAAAHYSGSSETFYQSKRLLNAFAANAYRTKARVGGKAVEYDRYLVVSALTVDLGTGACSALSDRRCSIYDRRPLACRAVPFPYSRPEASAEDDLDAFVGTAGFLCDISEAAPIVVDDGKITDLDAKEVRTQAAAVAERDSAWSKAIVRKMKQGSPDLPTLDEIEASASFAATTTSMSAAWQVAAERGLISSADWRRLIGTQVATIEREFGRNGVEHDVRQMLVDMRVEYRQLLEAS